MKNQETYTYKQILLRVRTELLQLNKELDKLKQYTTGNKRIRDYYFNLWPSIKLVPELYLFTEKESNMISFLKKLLGYQNTNRTSIMTKDNNGLYHIAYPGSHQVFFDFADREKFDQLADKILDSEVARKMPTDDITQGG